MSEFESFESLRPISPEKNIASILPESIEIWQDFFIEVYYKVKYGPSWRWYYLNYQVNHEFLF